jgi:hypothetical protein
VDASDAELLLTGPLVIDDERGTRAAREKDE